MREFLLLILIAGLSVTVMADRKMVEHEDVLQWDKALTLQQTLAMTLHHYPLTAVIRAKQQQSEAFQRRGDSLLAGAPVISGRFGSDELINDTGYMEIEAAIKLPLWRWGQRAAGQALGEESEVATSAYREVVRYRVAGLVREALWDMRLEENRHQLAEQVLETSSQMVETVFLLVEEGELPRADLLLAESDRLEKRSALTQAEAEVMHARQSYRSLTRSERAPAQFNESLSSLSEVGDQHPLLVASRAQVGQLSAELRWVRSAGSGQPSVIFGSKHERDFHNEPTINSLNVTVSLPFGGADHAAPAIAATNLALSEALAEQNSLVRQLEKEMHEAKHALEVDRAEQGIANEHQQISRQYLEMSRIGFRSGEIRLVEFLKTQARANAAVRSAKERAILYQRDIARYNQAVGVLP